VKVEVAKIKEEPFHVSQNIPAADWDLDSEDIKFFGEINLECDFQLCDREILVTGKVSLHRLIICSRCLQEVKQKQTKKLTLSYNTAELGEFLDIDPDVREEILLTFPLKVLCKDDCKGICADCGVDLNTDRCKCYKKD
jgi:uncharacterized protein